MQDRYNLALLSYIKGCIDTLPQVNNYQDEALDNISKAIRCVLNTDATEMSATAWVNLSSEEKTDLLEE